MGLFLSFSVENAETNGELGVFNCVYVGTIEVLGALKVVKEGISGELVVSCEVNTDGGSILEAFCEYKEDNDRLRLFSDVYTEDMRVFVVLCGVNVGTTWVSVAFSGVKVDIKD